MNLLKFVFSKDDRRISFIHCMIFAIILMVVLHILGRHTNPRQDNYQSRYIDEDYDEGIKKRFPGMLIIGVQKCGTQALAMFLQLHPKLKRAGNGEIHFFDRPEKFNKGLDFYKSLMPETDYTEIAFEKTPAYFDMADPREIHKMNKNVKIVIIFCDPVKRSVSAFDHRRDHGVFPENSSFIDLALDGDKVNTSCDIIYRGIYIEALQKYHNYFNEDQFLYIDQESFKTDPVKILRNVEQFLNITPFFKNSQFYFNETVGQFCIEPTYIYTSPRLDQQSGCMFSNKYRKHLPLEPHVEKKLIDFYNPLNKKLYQFTGIKYSWM
ncbi:unnamed protein product [Owenia fusiformis]|uniref:Uncharacterized protein n=1 Tax=Owenia fusiformis TaxID=6347 RepID=A0A8J1UPS3_OWEFU|nr:unnamed protein product [Owenia fusiformis]